MILSVGSLEEMGAGNDEDIESCHHRGEWLLELVSKLLTENVPLAIYIMVPRSNFQSSRVI